jgi:hypothetical protein
VTTLWNVTGHSSRAELRAETEKLVNMLRDSMEMMTDYEATFMTKMVDQVTLDESWVPTPKQLFWLRDLNLKY